MLDSRGDLAAVEVAFFAPTLLISLFITLRHGFRRQLGWLYLVILSLLRIIGGSCTLYSEVNNDYSPSLLEAAAITSAVGTAPLLLALMGILKRFNEGMNGQGLPASIFGLLQLLGTVALALAIAGGVFESKTTANDISTGQDLSRASSVLFLVLYLILAVCTILGLMKLRYVLKSETKLVYAAVASLPFLLVRIVFTICVGFSTPGSFFYFRDVNVWAEAFMQFMMEAIIVIMFICAGLLTPKSEAPREMMLDKPESVNNAYDMESGRQTYAPQQQTTYVQQPPRQQQPMRLGDYRPSRLIRNAISGR